ncbi:MAG: L,D-transpeptidase [Microthrixaceae bacterium]
MPMVIEVDLTARTLSLNGRTARCWKPRWPSAVEAPTPTGTFSITDKLRDR